MVNAAAILEQNLGGFTALYEARTMASPGASGRIRAVTVLVDAIPSSLWRARVDRCIRVVAVAVGRGVPITVVVVVLRVESVGLRLAGQLSGYERCPRCRRRPSPCASP